MENSEPWYKKLLSLPGIILGLVAFATLLFELATSTPSANRLVNSKWTFDRSGDGNHLLPMTLTFHENGLITPKGPLGQSDEIVNERKWNRKPFYKGGDLVIMSYSNDITSVITTCFREHMLFFGKYICEGETYTRGGHTHYLTEQ
ncbi:MAG: hypothetical protein HWE26_20055 [Alteromonadaceae bacterium]|nr:hypothetical protein [Alteromonadaceae bacterium]